MTLVLRLGWYFELWGACAVCMAVVVRFRDAVRIPSFRWLWGAAAVMAWNIATYVASVAGVFGPHGCGLAMNEWGVLSSGLVAIFAAVAAGRRWIWIAGLYSGVGIAIASIAYLEDEHPVGCVNKINVTWFEPFWWVLTLSHILAASLAIVFCLGSAQKMLHRGNNKITLRLLTAAFISQALFWIATLVVTITGMDQITDWSQFFIGAIAWLLAFGLLLPIVTRRCSQIHAAYTIQRLWPLHQFLGRALGAEITIRPPHLIELISDRSWPPKQRLYRLEVKLTDQVTAIRDAAARMSTLERGGPASTHQPFPRAADAIRKLDARYPDEQPSSYLRKLNVDLGEAK
ncbi:Uncharacterised protein [Mycobacteroides abscessus subsp. massiliense]|nr:Uncharacterised protein [Mycobacteroides abscessus subsp. massiliense]SKG90918.1 Uncharacterised protein [Mycobacteroides abscessus subsp. massiliense]SKI00391.1 Uncharacterised protein [Mycobacteroides abscessus subsp. massiliense]SKI96226.1 Uncharacterised protein [Mycobacteroides abscessus subsp. massiliense]SKJ12241.1 Uncharacterised protein [Mycobacteroides abscessus subsp. massiliense]